MNKKQRGLTLITVLILTSMASIVVLNSLRENLVQERLTGNFQKKINSRLLAEKGVFEEVKLLKQALNDNKALDVDGLIAAVGNATGSGLIGDDAIYNATLSKNAAGEIEIASQGQRYSGDANTNLVARYGVIPGKGSSVFKNAMVGCKGVNLSGSGSIDSYDSSLGSYEETKTSDGDVSTVAGEADVVLSGESPIKGDVKASGVIFLRGSSPIEGNIHSNTGVEISWGAGLRVSGNIYTQGYYLHQGGRVSGIVRANGNAEMKWTTFIDNNAEEGLDILYGGNGTFQDTQNHKQDLISYSDSRFNVNPQVEPVPVGDPSEPTYDPANPDTNCDPLNIPNKMPSLIADSSDFELLSVSSTQRYKLTPQRGGYSANGTSTLDPRVSDVFLFDRQKQNYPSNTSSKEYVYGLTGFSISSDGYFEVAGGDVILLIDGDFSMLGAAKLRIKKDSSLTVLLTGKVNIGAGAQVITEQEGLTTSGHPSLSFYSSYNGMNGVKFSGAANLYAAIYAPLTTVKLSGSGELFGTIRGAEIVASGGSGVHFDAGLQKVQNGGEPSQPAKIVFLGWSYKAPETIVEETEEETTP